MYKYKIQNSRYANGRWMSPIWGRNSFVGITKDFLTTMKTCKSGNSTKMFCPQMEDIRPQIMLHFGNIITLYSWMVDMLACPFVYICGCWGFINDVEKFYYICKPGVCSESNSIRTLYILEMLHLVFRVVYLGWYLLFGVFGVFVKDGEKFLLDLQTRRIGSNRILVAKQ